ncbi:MAG: hypothetical protein R2774_00165 [Saprospiraceae bacterium]
MYWPSQVIKAVDDKAPTFAVKDATVNVDPWGCVATYRVDNPWNCKTTVQNQMN